MIYLKKFGIVFKTVLQTFSLILVALVLLDCNSQTKNINVSSNTTSASIYRPIDESKIVGSIPDYDLKSTDLEYLQTLPMPEIQMFSLQISRKIDLDDTVKEILRLHWKQAIKFFYEDTFNKAKGQVGYKRDVAWANYCIQTEQKLSRVVIDAPNGKRNISPTEVSELYAFLNKEAGKIIAKAKAKNQND